MSHDVEERDSTEWELEPQRAGVWTGVAFAFVLAALFEAMVSYTQMQTRAEWLMWLVLAGVALVCSYYWYRDERGRAPA